MPVYDDQDQQEKDELDAINRLSGDQASNPSKERYANDIPSSILNSSANSNPDKTGGEEVNTEDNSGDSVEQNGVGNRLKDLVGQGFKSDTGKNQKSPGRIMRLITKDAKTAKRLKWIGGGGVTIGGLGLVAAFIIFLISSLAIPNFAQNITAYQFARTAMESAKNSSRITAEKLATDAADDAAKTAMRGRFGSAYDKFTSRYQPSKIIENMKSAQDLTLNYDDKNILRSVVVDGKTVDVRPTGFLGKVIPGLQFTKDLSFSRDFVPALETSLKASDVGPIVRSAVAQSIRRELGISLIAWNVGKYTGKSAEEARVIQQQEAFSKVNDVGGNADAARTSPDKAKSNQDIIDAETKAVNDPATMADSVRAGGGTPAVVDAAIESSVTPSAIDSAISKVTSVANPVFAIAVPLCMIYEGSLANSSSTIDAQNSEIQSTYYLVASAGSQQLAGNTPQEAVNAMNWKLQDHAGDTTASIADLRASGQQFDTTSSMSTEASPIGQFSIADALFPPVVAGIMNNAASICPAMTNVWLNLGVGVAALAASIVAAIGTGGASAAAEGVTEVAAEGAARAATETISSRIATVLAEKFSLKELRKFATQTIATGAVVGGATLVAKFITTTQIGVLHNGLDTGSSFKNDADAGGNLAANEIERQGYYGMPLTQQQWQESNSSAQQFALSQNKTKSVYDRYFAMTNPYSMLSRVATTINTNFNPTSFSSIASFFGKFLNPSNLVGRAMGMFTNQRALAAATSTNANTNYGIVQFGWTNDEQNLIDSNSSYQPIENQKILDDSGQASAIAAKYGTCFTSSMGTLLASADPAIQRTTDGDTITDKGLCAQTNLSYNSPDGLAVDRSADSPQSRDMIFRWRLAQNYSNTLDQLMNVQEITP